MSTPTAMCRSCADSPLVSTFHFYKAEFYCLDCGGTFGFLEPRAGESTPELLARSEAYAAEWAEHADALITPRSYLLDTCEQCKGARESHDQHATDDEWQAHRAAEAWLAARVKAVPA